MPLVQCKLGPAQTVVGDHTYDFRADEHGRYVAEVHNITHQTVLLSVEHYIIAPEISPRAAEAHSAPVVDLPAVLNSQTPVSEEQKKPIPRRGKGRGN